MKPLLHINFGVLVVISLLGGPAITYSSELSDGISEYREESIRADDTALESDTNLNFVIVDAISAARSGRGKSNFNDGLSDNNQNSIVIEAGVGDINGPITNIVIEQP